MKKVYESELIKCDLVSTNRSHYKNKRKTTKYRIMEELCDYQIKKILLKDDAAYRIEYEFYIKDLRSDADNFIKSFQDVLQKNIRKYCENFDDRQFYEIECKKFFPKCKENLGVKFKIFEIKLLKEKDGIKLKKDNKLGAENYE